MDTSFWWVNNERLRLPRHKYGTTSNKQTKTKKIEKKTREKKNEEKSHINDDDSCKVCC